MNIQEKINKFFIEQSQSKMRLFENIFSLFLLQGANYLLPLITVPYLVRILGPEKFGLIVFAQAFMQYFVIVTDYGFNLSATKQISINRDNQRRIGETFSAVMIIKLVLLLVSFFVMNLIILAIPRFSDDWNVYYIVFIAAIGSVLFPIWFFQGIQQMRYITMVNLATRIITTIAIFTFIRNQSDYIVFAIIQSLGGILAGIIALWIVISRYPYVLVVPSLSRIVEEVKNGWYVFLSTAAISLYTASNVFILGLLTNNTIVGYYSAAEKIVRPLVGLIGPISQSVYPHISALVVNSPTKALTFIRKCIFRLGTASFIISVLLLLGAEDIVDLILGEQYIQTVNIIRVMSFLPFIICLSNMFGIQTMLPFGFNKECSLLLISAGVINIILIIPLTITFSAIGTAISVVVTEIYVTLTMYILLIRKGIKLIKVNRWLI